VKRSFINARLREAVAFCRKMNCHLPPWAFWTPDRWKQVGHEADEIRRCNLGWDITDFGSGQYEKVGLLLFTLRNGTVAAIDDPLGKDYCEKVLLIDEQQVTPTHFHWSKMEDIINRGGGRLVLELWNADRQSESLDEETDVVVRCDGIERTVPPGGKVVLAPGESITLPPYLFHNFYAQRGGGMVLAGEVSRVNDDQTDNCFLDAQPRFPEIEEDEEPLYLLCNEYPPAKD